MAAIALNINKTHYNKNYTTLSNNDCQIRFEGDKLPSAKEIYLYLISLPSDWKISVKNVSKHFDTSIKYMQKLFDVIIKNDHMIALPLRKKSGKFSGMLYQVFQPDEQPQVVRRPPVKNDDKHPKINEKQSKQPEGVRRPAATYYKQKKHTKKTTTVVVPLFDPEIEKKLRDRPDIERQWISDSLKLPNQTCQNIILAIDKSESADDSTAFICSALKRCWEFKKTKEIKQGISSNSNEKLRENQGKKLIYKKKIYEVEEAGSIYTEFGCFNKYQIERLIENGVMQWK